MGAGAGLALATLWPGAAHAQIEPYAGLGAPYKVLEILQVGGASHAETVWMQSATSAAHWHRCATIPYGSYLSVDPYQMAGAWSPRQVSGSAWMSHVNRPLYGSPLWSRLRLVAVAHGLDPHGPAQILSLTGQSAGRPARVGLGAAVQAFKLQAGGTQPAAWSYVINTASGGLGTEAAAYGELGSSARPLVLPVGSGSTPLLGRMVRNQHAAGDDLLAMYGDQYGARLRFTTQGQPQVRSAGYVAWDAARARLPDAGTVRTALTSSPAYGLNPTSPLPYATALEKSRTRQAILAAANLLHNAGAAHVCVLDHGAAAPYDTHHVDDVQATARQKHSTIHNMNTYAIFAALREAHDAGILNLDNVLIHIHTDFGRFQESNGSNHWTRGFAHMLIGGPITTAAPTVRGGLTVSGPADLTGGIATHPLGGGRPALNPTDLRAVTMLAAGIDPFSSSPPLLPLSDLSQTYTGDVQAQVQAALSDLSGLLG